MDDASEGARSLRSQKHGCNCFSAFHKDSLTLGIGGGAPAPSAKLGSLLVKNIFADFKRHDLGPNFYERNYDGTLRRQFLTIPLWGVGSTAPYGHDGRSLNPTEVILRNGGEAQAARDTFAALDAQEQAYLIGFLNSLVLFPPDDTARIWIQEIVVR